MNACVLSFTAQNVVRINSQSELDFFQLFFNDELLQRIVHETNRYVKQKLTGRECGQAAFEKRGQINERNIEKLKAYLGVVMKRIKDQARF